MADNYRTRLIRWVTFLAGVYFFLEFILPSAIVKRWGVDTYHSNITNGFILVGTMAIGLGIINLFLVHGSNIAFKRKGWLNSIALLLGLIIMMTVTIADWVGGAAIEKQAAAVSNLGAFAARIEEDVEKNTPNVPSYETRVNALLSAAERELKETESTLEGKLATLPPAALASKVLRGEIERFRAGLKGAHTQLVAVKVAAQTESGGESVMHAAVLQFGASLRELGGGYRGVLQAIRTDSLVSSLWLLLYEGLFVPLGAAMFSLLGIYIASAAFRAFRVRSLEASLMMIAAVLVMLGQIPFGVLLWEGFPDVRDWLLKYPNSAAFRAITFGAGIAGLVMAFRMWLSLESDFTGDEE